MADKLPGNITSSPGDSPRERSFINRLIQVWVRFERFGWDIAGIICLALALMTLLASLFPDLSGGLLDVWVRFLRTWFGWGVIWVVIGISYTGLWMIRQRQELQVKKKSWGQLLLLECLAFASLALLAVIGNVSLERADQGLDGGRVGWGLAELLRNVITPLGLTHPIILTILIVSLTFVLLGMLLLQWSPIADWLGDLASRSRVGQSQIPGFGPAISEAPLSGAETEVSSAKGRGKKRTQIPPQFRKKLRMPEIEEEKPMETLPRDERLPPLDLLIYERTGKPDERNINMTAGLIEKTLAEFGIPAKVIGFRVGPTVTQFAVEPGYVERDTSDENGDPNRQKVRVSQISSLGRDLALALSAEQLRIEAPVPGRPYVGIEVPNTRSSIVRLRPILELEAFYKVGSPLAIALGRDVSGKPVIADLKSMPHLLIAGTTGSGKSVCIAALTTCLAMNNTPQDMRLVMIDPKMVELVRFNGLPHLYGKVETDIERILAVLRWTVAEMDRRYQILEASRSRNIDTYNRKAHRRKGMEILPHIVVMIDELADLMMSAPDQTEHNLVRLAQMARATGIHLVIATQRPSTDVVTGLIKANFPARISFAVASSVDSRVILDVTGAEHLLGRGDMLFLSPESSFPVRVQGVMINDTEVEKVITFWQQVAQSPEEEAAPWEEMLEMEQVLAERDQLVERAIEIVRQEQRASASMLQRRLRVGYPRASRLIDQLEEMGIVGPAVRGGRDREVLILPDDEDIE